MKQMTAMRPLWPGILATALTACGGGDTPPAPAPASQTAPEQAGAMNAAPHEIAAADAPTAVSAALSRARPELKITRVTEHERGNGVFMYEFSGTDAGGKEMKVAVKYDGKLAEVLTSDPPR